MKLNMNVFWVLFLVLLNTVENQGVPNQTVQDELPPYIVSIRDAQQCHVCTGSIITEKFVLSSTNCYKWKYVLHGLREFENCTNIQDGQYMSKIVDKIHTLLIRSALFKVVEALDSNLKLGLRTPSPSDPLTEGAVIGWSYDKTKSKFVLKKVDKVSFKKAFSKKSKRIMNTFYKTGTGSPLIVKNFIYGLLSGEENTFVNISLELDWIEEIIKNQTITLH